MQSQLQFQQSIESDQQRAARALARHGTPVSADVSAVLADQFSYDPKNPQSRGSSYDQYLYGRSLIREAGEKPDWQQTMTGRIMTRLVTRGVFGALAFTWAGSYANRSLKNYDPRSIESFGEWRKALFNPRAQPLAARQPAGIPADGTLSTEAFINQPNTMQAVAKMFDVVAGKPIKMGARLMGQGNNPKFWADKATHFRPRAAYHDPISKVKPSGQWEARIYGRSLGHEVVAITTDFAAASAADALSRNIVQAIDPNVEKDWYKDGHFSVSKFGKDWAKRLWQVASFNQGEDWAVAVPYAYFMKWHRNVIDKFSPGFKYASDHGQWNGACEKALARFDNGKPLKLENIGNFQAESAWDLQARFTVYNVLTLMYREAYKSVGSSVSGWWKGSSWMPNVSLPSNPIESAIEGAGNAVRYAAKSFIKANLYMQPAVPFFWVFRVAQNKWRGSPIIVNDIHNPAEAFPDGSNPRIPSLIESTPRSVHADLKKYRFLPDDAANSQLIENYFTSAEKPKQHKSLNNVAFARAGDQRIVLGGKENPAQNVFAGKFEFRDHDFKSRNPFDPSKATSSFAAITNPFGLASNKAGNFIGDSIVKAPLGVQKVAHSLLGAPYNPHDTAESRAAALRTNAHTFVDASFAYTPYMIAKAETARRWDNKDMDSAIYRLMDGVVSFNLSEAKSALKDIGNILTNPPPTVEDPGFLLNKPEDSKPANTIAASSVSRASVVHPEHRTLQ